MDISFSLLFAVLVGFGHAFEADHLLAVSSLVSKRRSRIAAVKDGIYWGLGHSSTIFLIGLLMIVGKSTALLGYFHYFEVLVGVALLMLGAQRLHRHYRSRRRSSVATRGHQLAYSVGLVHGLAGSGTMVLLVMTEIQGRVESLLYLLLFGAGSVAGMLTAAGVFSLPFSRKITAEDSPIRTVLTLLSSLLCIGYGGWMIYRHLS